MFSLGLCINLNNKCITSLSHFGKQIYQMQNVFIYVYIHGNKYKLIDIINILELIFIINMLISIYYSNTTHTQLIPTNTNQCTVIAHVTHI